MSLPINARHFAFLVLCQEYKSHTFIKTIFNTYDKSGKIPSDIRSQAWSITIGVIKNRSFLDYQIPFFSPEKKLKLKVKEKMILRIALYEHFFLSTPSYAIAYELKQVVEKNCYHAFLSLFTAFIKYLEKQTAINLPNTSSIKDLSIRYSHPIFFIETLLHQTSREQTYSILNHNLKPMPTFYWYLKEKKSPHPPTFKKLSPNTPLNSIDLQQTYIQNPTPSKLIHFLSRKTPIIPENILDICASPGGKTLLTHRYYPQASLSVNDVKSQKIENMKQNFDKAYIAIDNYYQTDATLLHPEHLFDLIIVDAPCSNSGVFRKKPEAKWRLNKENVLIITLLQKKILENALNLLNNKGILWYITCSILPQENEHILLYLKQFNLLHLGQYLQLPSKNGLDGGFACALQKV